MRTIQTPSMSQKVDRLLTRDMLRLLILIAFLGQLFPRPCKQARKNRAGISIPPLFVADKSRHQSFSIFGADFIQLAITMAYFAQALIS
jgi:hypothetical protein